MNRDGSADLRRRAEDLGVRMLAPRSQVIHVIDELGRPFSAGELLEEVERQAPSIGRATVFRTLQLLCDLDLLERVRLEDGQDVYVVGHSHGHHHHLICTECAEITEVDGCSVDSFVEAVAKRHGFEAQTHTFDIYGICSKCRADVK